MQCPWCRGEVKVHRGELVKAGAIRLNPGDVVRFKMGEDHDTKEGVVYDADYRDPYRCGDPQYLVVVPHGGRYGVFVSQIVEVVCHDVETGEAARTA